jgi:hypothetical protein
MEFSLVIIELDIKESRQQPSCGLDEGINECVEASAERDLRLQN